MELATTDMILPAVRHNLGLGFIPAEFADAELKSGQVFEIKVKEKLPERNIILIYDMEYPQSIAAKEFQKFLKEGGILEELEKAGIQEGDTVRMYGFDFDYYK